MKLEVHYVYFSYHGVPLYILHKTNKHLNIYFSYSVPLGMWGLIQILPSPIAAGN